MQLFSIHISLTDKICSNTRQTLRVDFALCRLTLAGKWQKFCAPRLEVKLKAKLESKRREDRDLLKVPTGCRVQGAESRVQGALLFALCFLGLRTL